MNIPPFLIPFVWFLLGLLMMVGEVFIPGFVIFFFGLGAVVNGILTAVFPFLRSRIVFQILIWLGTSGLSLFLLRKYFARIFKGRFLEKKEETEPTGKTAKVIEEIRPDKPGRVRFQGTSWRAICYDETFQKGDKVEILKQENLTIVVTKSILGELTKEFGPDE